MRCQKHRNNVADADCPICLKEERDLLRTELSTHMQEGGVKMKCGHPVQCAYAQAEIDGGNGCAMCDLEAELDEAEEIVRRLEHE